MEEIFFKIFIKFGDLQIDCLKYVLKRNIRRWIINHYLLQVHQIKHENCISKLTLFVNKFSQSAVLLFFNNWCTKALNVLFCVHTASLRFCSSAIASAPMFLKYTNATTVMEMNIIKFMQRMPCVYSIPFFQQFFHSKLGWHIKHGLKNFRRMNRNLD